MKKSTISYNDIASFYHTALLLGLLPGGHVVRWAESVIEQNDNVPYPFIELVNIPQHDITSLRYALLNLCTERIPHSVLNGIFGLVFYDFDSRKRSLHDTITVLSQIRRFTMPDKNMYDQILALETHYSDANSSGERVRFQEELYGWLKQYSEKEKVFL